MGQWRYSLQTDKLTETIQIAQRIYSLAHEQKDCALLIGAYNALAGTLYLWGISSERTNTRRVVLRSGTRKA
jgi:hypothetical protein